MAMARQTRGYLERPRPSGLADVIDVILDKGLVIDAYVRVSLIGIEILTIDARIVMASVDTYLRFAEAVNRLDIGSTEDAQGLPELMESLTSAAPSRRPRARSRASRRSSSAATTTTIRTRRRSRRASRRAGLALVELVLRALILRGCRRVSGSRWVSVR